jgi:RHS repeat-associated protein
LESIVNVQAVRRLCVLPLLSVAASICLSQSQVGIPPWSSFASDSLTSVNLANLNIHLEIPIRSLPGRGLPLSVTMATDTNTLGTPAPLFGPGSQVGWPGTLRGIFSWTPVFGNFITYGIGSGSVSFSQTNKQCTVGSTNYGSYTVFSNFIYFDTHGTIHNFPSSLQVATLTQGVGNPIQCPNFAPNPSGYGTNQFAGYALDGSSYALYLSGGSLAPSAYVLDTDTGIVNESIDANGDSISNFFDATGAQYIVDSTGTVHLVVIRDGFTNSGFSYIRADGFNGVTTLTMTNINTTGGVSCPNVPAIGPATNIPVVTAISLPDGTSYGFTYDPVLGRVKTITLPTGGTITYNYNGPNSGVSCEDGNTSGFTKTTPDGTWTYSRTYNSTSSLWTTTVTDPQGNQTVYTFGSGTGFWSYALNKGALFAQYEIQRQVFQKVAGSQVLLKTVVTCYNQNFTNCASDSLPTASAATNNNSVPPFQKDIYTSYPNVTGSSLSEIRFHGANSILEDKEYGFGASTPPGNNFISDRQLTYGAYSCVTSDITADSSGTLSKTTAVCDNFGHQTSITRWSSGSASATTTNSYNSNGLMYKSVDPRSITTNITYGACNGSFPTLISTGSLSTSYEWDCNGEVKTSSTDANSQKTTYSYVDSSGYGDPFWRLMKETRPDGGTTSHAYNDRDPQPNMVMTVLRDSAGDAISTTVKVDGLNRPVKVITSSPQSANSINVDTTYDPLGRVSSVSNPYYSTSDSTYGITHYYYDALGRTVQTLKQDGTSSEWWCYYNKQTNGQPNCRGALASTPGFWADHQDEAGNDTQSTEDGLGRLIAVAEPNGATQVPSMETDYHYSGIGNLLQVDQYGGAKGTSPFVERQRKFTYDWMSRLSQALNPESGWTCFGTTGGAAPNGSNCTPAYDPDGNLTDKTDGRGVNTHYSFDALNRLTQKSYSDGTPTVKYGYDGLDVNGVTISPAVSYATGRLSQSTAAVLNVSSTYSYDKMGRLISRSGCIPGDCAGHVKIAATYDFMGNKLTLSNGLTNHPITWTYTYEGLARLQTITASTSIDSITKIYDASPSSSYGADGLENASFGYNNTTSQYLVSYQHRNDSRLRSTYGGYLNSSGAVLYSYCMPGSGNANCSGAGSPYTANSNLAKVIDSVTGTWSYGYDTLNRLSNGIASSGSYNGKAACWVYDPFGNRTSEALSTTACNNNPPKTSWADYTTSNTNRMDSTSNNTGQINGYDTSGNETTDGLNSYLYDAEGRICAVGTSSRAPIAGYIYDADGDRVGKFTPSTFSCASPSVVTAGMVLGFEGEQLSEVTGSGFWDHSNAFANGQLLATYKSSHLYFSLNDWLGTRRAELSRSCTPLTTYSNLPFGTALTTTGGCPYTTEQHFTGKERDSDSTNDYFGARYYTSTMGRFLSADDSDLSNTDLANPQSLNLYSYAGNSPLKNIDPDGHYYCDPDTFVTNSAGDAQVLTAGACHLEWSDIKQYFNDQFGYYKARTSELGDLASQAAHQFGNIMSTPGGAKCMAATTVGGAMVGGGSGAVAGLAGLAGGPAVVVTEPSAVAVGGLGGGSAGFMTGMIACPGGAGGGGGGGSSGSRGSTGRGPKNVKEQLAVEQAEADPQAGTVAPVKGGMKDVRWPGSQGWVKMRQNINGVEVHYVRNTITQEVDDFKVAN